MRARELAVGPVPCLALRVTYVGELGWELYCPTEFGLALWDAIWEPGPRARPRRRRLPGDRLAAAREGLPRLGLGHHARRHARSRRASASRSSSTRATSSAVRRCSRKPEPRAAALLPRPRRPARGRARLRAGPRRGRDRRPRHERRLRLLGRALDRLRLPARRARPGRASRSRSRSSASWVAGEVAAEPLFDPAGRAHPRVIEALVERIWPGGVEAGRAARRRDHQPQLQGARGRRALRAPDRRQRHRAARDRPRGRARGLARRGRARDRARGRRFLEPEGYLVTRFVEGEVGQVTRRRRQPPLLRRLHGGPPIPGRFDAFRVVEAYAATAARGGRLAARRATPRRRRSPTGSSARRGPVHADALPQRPARRELHPRRERLWIVDWEYAGMGDPAFDLANFAVNNGLDEPGDRDAPRRLRRRRRSTPRAHALHVGLPRGDVGRRPAGDLEPRLRLRRLRRPSTSTRLERAAAEPRFADALS